MSEVKGHWSRVTDQGSVAMDQGLKIKDHSSVIQGCSNEELNSNYILISIFLFWLCRSVIIRLTRCHCLESRLHLT